MRSSRDLREPSITRSPARITAPPISDASTSACTRTLRLKRLASAAAICSRSAVAAWQQQRSPSHRRCLRRRPSASGTAPRSRGGIRDDGCRPAGAGNCCPLRPVPSVPATSVTSCASCAGVTLRAADQRSDALIGNRGGATIQQRRPRVQRAGALRLREGRLGVGTRDGAAICHLRSLWPACRAGPRVRLASISRPSSFDAELTASCATSLRRSSRALVVASSICCCARLRPVVRLLPVP